MPPPSVATETKTGAPHCKRAKVRTEDCLHSKREAAAGYQWKNHHREGRRAGRYQEERFPEGERGVPEGGHGAGGVKCPTSHGSMPEKYSKQYYLKSL